MQTPAILGSLRLPATGVPSAPNLLKVLAGQTLEATLEAVLPEGLALRLADGRLLEAKGSLPFLPGSLLSLKALPLPGGAGLRLQVLAATSPPGPAVLAPLIQGEAAPLLARLAAGSGPEGLAALLGELLRAGASAADQPEAWARWMREAMSAVADPATAPEGAAFHRLQAKEGTAWFELPLPWAPGAEPLRIWIEQDEASAAQETDPVRRVFLSVPFSTLGEVRLGLEQRAAGLTARLWMQDPASLDGLKPSLEAELATLGRPVNLQLLRLPAESPDLRTLAGAPPIQALG